MFSFFKKKSDKAVLNTTPLIPVTKYLFPHIIASQTALGLLEEGDYSQLHTAYEFIVENKDNTEYITRLGSAITCMFEYMNCTQKIRLSETFRQYSSMEWYSDWATFDVSSLSNMFKDQRDFISILIIGSIHPNGYFRERCLRLLSSYRSSLPFIILRINDWIGNIRQTAYEIASGMSDECSVAEIFGTIPYVEKVNKSMRRDKEQIISLDSKIISHIKDDITQKDITDIADSKDYICKRYVYKMLFSEKIIPDDLANEIIQKEKNKFLKSLVTCRYIQLYNPDEEQINVLLSDRSYLVRYTAALYKYNIVKNVWNGMEILLLDSRRTIREYAVYLLKKHIDFDVVKFYKEHLKSTECIYAVIGIGEYGTKNDTEFLIQYLNSDNSGLISAALTAIEKLTGYESAEIYWKYLFNGYRSVSKTAYLMIHKSRSQYGSQRVYDAFTKCKDDCIRRYLIKILINENSWDRLPYLLKLYNYDDEYLRNCIHDAIDMRNPYAKISEKLGDHIKAEIMCQHDILPEELIWKIEHDLQYVIR